MPYEENDFRRDFAQYDDTFANTEVEDRPESLPDGYYQAVIESAELTRSKTTSKPMLKWKLKVLGPKCAGRVAWRNNIIASDENIKWLKQDLHTCGLTLARLSDLPHRVDELIGVRVNIQKKTKGDNENVYINSRMSAEDDAATAAGNGTGGSSGSTDKEYDQKYAEASSPF